MVGRIYWPLLTLLPTALLTVSCGSFGAAQISTTISPATVSTGVPGKSTASATKALSNLSMQDLSWISPTEGWVLYRKGCGTTSCQAYLAHTADGGATWQKLPSPPVDLAPPQYPMCSKSTCVSHVRFANQNDGYLYGSSFFITTDGGHSWQAQSGLSVEALEITGNKVFRVTYAGVGCSSLCKPTLQESSPGSADWKTLLAGLSHPSQSSSAQFANSGSALLLALPDFRT